jgi:hypothetical protein
MQKVEKSDINVVFEVGDLVEIQFLGRRDPTDFGIVTGRVHYGGHKGNHPDEYSCKIMLLGTQREIEVRAKWIKMLSKSKKRAAT